MTDRLALANAIVDAGIERTKAERLASMIVDLIHDEVALLGDISKVQARLRLVAYRLLLWIGGLGERTA